MKYIVLPTLLCLLIAGLQAQDPQPDSTRSKSDAILANKLYNESIGLYENQKYIEAVGMLNKAIRLRPDFAQAYYNRGCVNLAMKNYEDALTDIDQAMAIRIDPGYLTAKGYIYLQQGDFPSANETLTLAITDDDENEEAHYYRGCALMAMNRNSSALADFDRAIALKPDYALAYNERGRLQFLEKNFENAKTDFTRAVTFDQTLAVGYNNLGKVLEATGDMEEATEYFTTALKINRDFSEAYINRGKINYRTDKYKEAISDFTKAIEIQPQNAGAFNDLGLAKYMNGDLKGAVESFSEAIGLKADYAEAWLNRGIVREMLRDTNGACKDWTKAADLGHADAMKYINDQCQ